MTIYDNGGPRCLEDRSQLGTVQLGPPRYSVVGGTAPRTWTDAWRKITEATLWGRVDLERIFRADVSNRWRSERDVTFVYDIARFGRLEFF